ncbi:MAG: hypothetical protein Q9187_008957, partial [Circinaria calcarea]
AKGAVSPKTRTRLITGARDREARRVVSTLMPILRFHMSIAHRLQSANDATTTKTELDLNLLVRAHHYRKYGT